MNIGRAKYGNDKSHSEAGKEPNGSKLLRQFPVSGTDQSGNVVAGANADHKGQCLDDGHGRKNNAHGTGGAGPELTYKKSIRHVVDGSHQHTDDGRNGQLRDHASYRRMGHFIVLVMCFFCLFHDNISCLNRSVRYSLYHHLDNDAMPNPCNSFILLFSFCYLPTRT